MITLRSNREIDRMRKAGRVVWEAHQRVRDRVAPGVTTAELNEAIAETFAKYDAEPLFKGVPGKIPFPAESCISVNEEVVHGIPNDRVLVAGDIVSVDTGCRIEGWCGDAAVTHAVGAITEPVRDLMEATLGVLNLAIELLTKRDKWSEIAKEMQQYVESRGFSVIEDFVGHGIGREMHEPPQVPNFYSQRLEERDFKLQPGLVLAVEPMVAAGRPEVHCLDDHWTQVTSDGSHSVHFEHTLALTSAGVEVLTGPPDQGPSG